MSQEAVRELQKQEVIAKGTFERVNLMMCSAINSGYPEEAGRHAAKLGKVRNKIVRLQTAQSEILLNTSRSRKEE